MKFPGMILLTLGFVSLLLEFLGVNLVVLNCLSQWGGAASWAIRVSAVVLGAILYFVYRDD
ncbi:hypothetical protein [Pontibacter beigongshangensis]|uniref:hypothetical protein n=1 Tax=Pontibacter beigongshangensis TaxID=2574733 RepID=UPI00164F0770|nr:hypothetical protein [Pontibacter beigongshangensis]